jgi:hypothetical protein
MILFDTADERELTRFSFPRQNKELAVYRRFLPLCREQRARRYRIAGRNDGPVSPASSPPFIRVDCAAPVTEGAFDLLAPAAFAALTAKTAKHLIEDIRAITRSVAIWTRDLPVAKTVRASALRDRRRSPLLVGKHMGTRWADSQPRPVC